MSSIFISYAHEDMAFVRSLAEVVAKAGYTLWVDWESIPAASTWRQEIEDGIDGADAFIAVLSPSYIASNMCAHEAAHAAQVHKKIVPVLIQDVDVTTLPPAVASVQWIPFRVTDDPIEAAHQVFLALETDLAYRERSTQLLTRALHWESQQHNNSLALRGTELADAEKLLAEGVEKKPSPNALQVQFVAYSRRVASRRLRTLVIALSVGLLVTVSLSIFSGIQFVTAVAETQKVLAESKVIQAQAVAGQANAALLNDTMDQALLLGVEATRRSDTQDARNALFDALETNSYLDDVLQSSLVGRPPNERIDQVAFSADGRRALAASTGGSDLSGTLSPVGQITTWDVPTGRKLHSFSVNCPPIGGAAFNADGSLVAIIAGDGCPPGIQIWNTQTGVHVRDLAETQVDGGPSDAALAFSPRGNLLAVGACAGNPCAATSVDLWDVTSGALVGRLPFDEYSRATVALAFSPDGSTLAAAVCSLDSSDTCIDNYMQVWDVAAETQRYVLRPPTSQNADFTDVAFSPDGSTLALGGNGTSVLGASVAFFQASTGAAADLPIIQIGDSVNTLAYTVDGADLIISSFGSNALQIWNIATGSLVNTLVGHTQAEATLAVSADGLHFLSGGLDDQVLLWRTNPYAPRTIPTPSYTGGSYLLPAASFDGSKLCAIDMQGNVLIWDLATGKQIDEIVPAAMGLQSDGLLRAAVSSDGKLVALGLADRVVLWDRVSRRMTSISIEVGASATYGYGYLAFSRGGKYLAALTYPYQQGYLFDVASGVVVQMFNQTAALAMSPDGRTLAILQVRGEHYVEVFDLESMNMYTAMPQGAGNTGNIVALAFSPHGDTLATVDDTGTASVWGLSNGRVQDHFSVGVNGSRSLSSFQVAYSPDGSTIAATDGQTLTLWDLAQHQQLVRPILDTSATLGTMIFGPKGTFLVTADVAGPLTMRLVTVAGWQQEACAIADRNLTRQEWRQFFGSESYRKTCATM